MSDGGRERGGERGAPPVDPASATMRVPAGPATLPAPVADRTPTLPATPADLPPTPEARTLPASGKMPPQEADGAARTDLDLAGPAAARYALERELGRGGMGAVYQVFDRELDRRVALKVVLGDARHDPDLTGRFVEEARAMARLEHPGIVPIHDLGQDARGRLFFTMKLVEGRTLARAVEEARLPARAATGERLSLFRLLEVFADIGRAVGFAHERGIVHRDLKPQNIMLGRHGEVHVMDWGLAKALGRAPTPRPAGRERGGARAGADGPISERAAGREETLSGSVLGTPAYMSPEQASGRVESVGPASDVFSLGAILYHVLTGGPPFEAPSMTALLEKVREARPRPPRALAPEVPEEVEAICAKAMAREPEARYASAGALAEDVQAYLEHRPVLARPPSLPAQVRLLYRRHRALARVLLVTAALVLALTAWYVVRLRREHAEADTARRLATDRLAEILRLADMKRQEDFEREAAALWPARPERVPAYEAWLEKARALAGRLPTHRATLAALDARPRASLGDEARWERDALAGLVRGLERLVDPDPFTGAIASIAARLEAARTIRERTVTAHAALWARTVEAIAAAPAYRGLRIAPQLGLVPLGPDPTTGLQEFADATTGAPPARDAEGRLRPTDETGVVLVLLPGGPFRMGAVRPASAAPGETNVDPLADDDAGPPLEIDLAPFFASKYEMTQGQWLRLAGRNPSDAAAGEEQHGRLVTLAHPVESVSFLDAEAMLARAGLRLPTEAQWEYAARGGGRAPWPSGTMRESVEGAANVADRAAKARLGASPRGFDEWLDDGFAGHAPVGSLRPNAFGLHDVMGNVWEWCDDVYGPYAGRPWRPGDGRRPLDDDEKRVNRGGCWRRTSVDARAARRHWDSADSVDDDLGVRPARALEP